MPSAQWLRALQLAVILPAVALTALVLLSGASMQPEDLALTVGLVVLANLLPFELYDRSSFSVDVAPIFMAAILFGPVGAIAGTWTAALVRGALRRSRWDKVLFNGSVFTLGALLASAILRGGAAPLSNRELGPYVLATLLASVAYYLHSFPVAAAIALDAGAPIREVWTRSFRWLFPHYLMLGTMGLALAIATAELGLLGTAIFFAPPLMMRVVLKQYTDRTRVAVERLEAANAELQVSTRELRRRGDDLALLGDVGQILASEPLPSTLLAAVARRCVPSLGDGCWLLSMEPAGTPGLVVQAATATPAAQQVRQRLEGVSPEALAAWAETVAARDSSASTGSLAGPLSTPETPGRWLAEPLGGRARTLGWLITWIAARPAESGSGSVSALDVADRLRLTREVAQRAALALESSALLQEAAAVDALRAVDRATTEFIAIAAHELRTPLTSLQGFAELLQTSTVDAHLHRRWLGILHKEAVHLGSLLDQLLDVSRLQAQQYPRERERVDAESAIRRVLDSFAGQAAVTGHSLDRDLPPGLPPVYANESHLERVLSSLLSNALKYSPHGGAIRVSASVHASGDAVEVAVRDEGLGVPPEWKERIFERFQRVERPEQATVRGTGLGLYIARQLVELNNGRLWIESNQPDPGSTFSFTLPVFVKGPAPRAAYPSPPPTRVPRAASRSR